MDLIERLLGIDVSALSDEDAHLPVMSALAFRVDA